MSLTCLERQKLSVIKKLRENVANTRPEGQVQDVNGNYAGKDLERRHSKLRNTMAIKSFGMNINTPGCLTCGLRVVFVHFVFVLFRAHFRFIKMTLVNAVIIHIHFTDCTKVVDSKNESIGYGSQRKRAAKF
jgi:hypothetical protein